MMDRTEFVQIMTMIGVAHGKEFDEARLEIYYKVFRIYDRERFRLASEYCIEHIAHLPKISQLKEALAITAPTPPPAPIELEPELTEDEKKYRDVYWDYFGEIARASTTPNQIHWSDEVAYQRALAAGVSIEFIEQKRQENIEEEKDE